MGNKKLEVKVLAENFVQKEGLLAEHGLSFLIKYQGQQYLFDTGQGLVLQHNVQQLDVDLNQVAGVLISHGHHDHGGGLKEVLDIVPEVTVYAHPGIFKPKYSQYQAGSSFRGIDVSRKHINQFIATTEPTEIKSGLWLTGEIPRVKQGGTTSDKYQLKVDGEFKRDKFIDDQAVFVETNGGVIVLLACTHAGVVNTLDYIQQVTDDRISAVIGGMHLVNTAESEIKQVVNYLADLELDLLVPLHCTGKKAKQLMIQQLPVVVEQAAVGDKFTF